MTPEEKAKAYDEAIDKVAHFIKKHIGFGCMIHPNSSEAKELFNIFPELRESENEGIRKAILNYFTKCWGNCKDDVCGAYVEDVIAWLEKQGEQKPVWSEEVKGSTDAFIEKACEWLRNNSHNYANNALGKEYLVNDFKNYMKGE